jgi:CBS domain-containing protein
MENRGQKYLATFKKLEARLRKIAGAGNSTMQFKDIVEKAGNKNPAVMAKKGIIGNLYGLRNVFAHADMDKYIADVNDLAFAEIDKIIGLLDNPPKAIDIFGGDVFIARLNDDMGVVLRKMKDNLYTHIPVYDNDRFIGILSEATILEWLVENINEGGIAYFMEQKVGDINRGYLHPKTNECKFIKQTASIFEIYKMFEDAIYGKNRLGAVLITKNGTKDEKPLGIITAWDLPKLKDCLA